MATFTPNFSLIKPQVGSALDADIWGTQWNTNADILDTQIQANADAIANIDPGPPIGSMIDWPGTTAPTDWALCYGQAISRTTFSDLFGVIGTTYGTGDGSTTFNVPDIRGRVVAGQDDMGGVSANRLTGQTGGVDGDVLGGTGGAETHTLDISEMPAHDHDVNTIAQGESTNHSSGTVPTGHNTLTTGGSPNANSISTTGGGGAHNNVQPTIILNKIIKTT